MTNIENIKVREFQPDDLPAVLEMIYRTIDISFAGVYPPSAWEHFKEHHSPKEILRDASEGETIVLEENDSIIATGTLVNGKITRVYVDAPQQGSGLGKRIMKILEQRAKDTGLQSLFLYSSTVAKPFYLGIGYRIEAGKAATMPDGELLEYIEMKKSLRSNS